MINDTICFIQRQVSYFIHYSFLVQIQLDTVTQTFYTFGD